MVFILLLFAVIGVVAALLSGRLATSMAPPTANRPVTGLPGSPLDSTDVEMVRFSVGLRGYRMDEVDDALDRLRDEIGMLRKELRARDDEIVSLRSAKTSAPEPGRGHADRDPIRRDPTT